MAEDEKSTQGEEMIGKLIAAAGRGPTAPPKARERIYSTVLSHWKDRLGRPAGRVETSSGAASDAAHRMPRRRGRSVRIFALAASVAMVALTLSWLQGDRSGLVSAELAEFTRIQGLTELSRDGETSLLQLPASTGSILAGDILRTGDDGRAALQLGDELIIRVNVDSELHFVDPTEVELVAGTIYIDSGQGSSNPTLDVRTPLGGIRHVGTQYEVNLSDSSLRVRVREGRVSISGDSIDVVGVAGEQIDVESDGLARTSAIAPDDAAWDWATGLATLPERNEFVIGETLQWVARERGLMLQYADVIVERRLGDEVVFGLEGLDPFDALDVLERTAGLRIEIDGLRLVVAN